MITIFNTTQEGSARLLYSVLDQLSDGNVAGAFAHHMGKSFLVLAVDAIKFVACPVRQGAGCYFASLGVVGLKMLAKKSDWLRYQ